MAHVTVLYFTKTDIIISKMVVSVYVNNIQGGSSKLNWIPRVDYSLI